MPTQTADSSMGHDQPGHSGRLATQPDPRCTRLKQIIDLSAELLPAQGPISAFVFLNALQALEEMPFDEGLRKGARLFGCQPYFPEEKYRRRLIQRRIEPDDLIAELKHELGASANAPITPSGTRLDLWLTMLNYPLRSVKDHEMQWFLAETQALQKMRSEIQTTAREHFLAVTRRWVLHDLAREHKSNSNGSPPAREDKHNSRPLAADLIEHYGAATIESWPESTWETVSLNILYRVCREGVHALPPPPAEPAELERHRDLLLTATSQDSDILVHQMLIRFCAAYSDQGMAQWGLPHRDLGFFKSFAMLYAEGNSHSAPWLQGLSAELVRIAAAGLTPLDSVCESLDLLGVPDEHWEEYIQKSLLALRGWAGQIWQMESRGDRVAIPAPPGTLVEFLAVRLMLDRLALAFIARHSLNFQGDLCQLADVARQQSTKPPGVSVDHRAFLVFELAQFMGWMPPVLHALQPSQWQELVTEIEAISTLELRSIFHRAFEGRMRTETLDAIACHLQKSPQTVSETARPRFQTAFCIDAREESFRRHQEEVCPEAETISLAGFYCVAMYYKGIADAHYAALCPIVIRPKHWVVEDTLAAYDKAHQMRSRARRALGAASYQIHVDSRSFIGGTVLAGVFGLLASIPLVGRVLFPALTGKIRSGLGRFVQPPPVTRLRLERSTSEPGDTGNQIGFSLTEMANIAERVLRDVGLINRLSRLVLLFGHGSGALNNPHISAYNCGACSGGAGDPNARAMAAMFNDPRVRDVLASHGVKIPDDTFFVGGLHNTCDDTLTFHDEDLIPTSHAKDFEEAKNILAEVCRRNAHERCRRFYSAPLNISLNESHRHVKRRSEDLAQPRPEYGNASNALCFVGRRQRIRGLFFDRRAFLHSYDPTQDDAEQTILARILSAVVPVCSGISMQYFFSAVDTDGWACGTKLPHNVASLLGVMDGAESDLRSGLPTQGVEIHEPLRLLFIFEATPTAMLGIMERDAVIGRILRNGWGQLALLDPLSTEIRVYRNGEFELYQPTTSEIPQAISSFDWYGGRRDHLGFAEINVPQ